MRQNIKWTETEDRRLLTLISENAGNITQAFRLFAEEHPQRTFHAAQFRWYGVLKLRSNGNICLITIDRKHKYINSKNSKVLSKPNKSTVSIWRRILNLLNL